MNKKILVLLLLTHNAYAGFNGLTHHSRANCVNNETISWDFTNPHELKVISRHINKMGSIDHTITEDWSNTKRSAAIHWTEGFYAGYPPWTVIGDHYIKDIKGNPILAKHDNVINCSIEDGWIDMADIKKPGDK